MLRVKTGRSAADRTGSRSGIGAQRAAGMAMAVAAITFWISWYLMPDQGTADTMHILRIVHEARDAVFVSVVVQIFSSVVYALAIVLYLVSFSGHSRSTVAGSVLLIIGAMGMCADAFFHLLAAFMTDEAVHLQEHTVLIMQAMQTRGILFLAPLLLPFFAGTFLLAAGSSRSGATDRLPLHIATLAVMIAVVGAVIVNTVIGHGRGILVLVVLGLFALSHLVMGFQWMRGRAV
jgi:hypothetical protein